MTSSEPRSPELAPKVEDFQSPVKSLRKLLRGVCDPGKAAAFDSDEEDDVNYDLYLQKGTSSPISTIPSSLEEDNIAVKVTPPPPPPEEDSSSPSEDHMGSPRRVLFPKYSNGKATKEESPQSEATEKMGSGSKEECDGHNLATPPSGNITSSEKGASMKQKPPGVGWIRRILFIAVINCLVVGAAVYYMDTVSGGEGINNLMTRIRKYQDQISNKLTTSDGTTDIAQKLSDPPKVEPSSETEESATETSWLDSMYGDAEDTLTQTYDRTQVYLRETVGYLLLDLGEKQNQILEVMYEYQESIQKATSSTTNQLLDITKYYSDLETVQNLTVALELFLQQFSGNNTWEQMGIDFSLARWKEHSSSASEYFEPIQKTLELVLAKVNLEHVHNTWLGSLTEHVPEMNGLDENIYKKLVEIGDTMVFYYEESGLRQYVGNVETKLKETIGEENIAIVDEKWAEILDGLAKYYNNNSLKEYLHFESTSIVHEDETADLSEESVEGDEDDDNSMASISTDSSPEEMNEEESPESEESSTENEVVDPVSDFEPDENSQTVSDEDIANEDIGDDVLDMVEVEANAEEEASVDKELEQPDLDENDEELASEKDSEINSIDPALDEIAEEASSDEEDEEEYIGAEEEEEEMENSDGFEIEESEEDADIDTIESSVDEKYTEEEHDDTNPNDDIESSGSDEDPDTLIEDNSSVDEPALEEQLNEEKVEDQDSDEDPEIIDNQSSLGEQEIPIEESVDTDINPSEDSGSEEDSEEIVDSKPLLDEKVTEEIEEEPENLEPDESEVTSSPEDSDKEIDGESSFDGETTNEDPAEEDSKDIDHIDSEESSLAEDNSDEVIDENASSDGENTSNLPAEEYSEEKDPIEAGAFTLEDDEEEGATDDQSAFVETNEGEAPVDETDEDPGIQETDEVLKEEEENEMMNEEIPENEKSIDEPQESLESGDDDEDSDTITNDEATAVEEDETPMEETAVENEMDEIQDGDTSDDNDSKAANVVKEDADSEDSTTASIEIPERDIPAMIRQIQEITKRDDASLPPPPPDISDMIQGIEDMLRKANIPRANQLDTDGDPPELKARKNWNTPSGWMARKQRSP